MMSQVASSPDNNESKEIKGIKKNYAKFMQIYTSYLDYSTIFIKTRWAFFFAIMFIFIFRIYMVQGFYIIAYGLGLHLLSLFIGFISPHDDPEAEGTVLPMKEDNGEFKPFIRRLLEFKFWVSGTKAILLCLFLTLFPLLDLAVFWPLLLVYFVLLVFLTIKQQIAKMIKYKYVPFSWGKETYRDITRGTTASSSPPSSHPSSATSNIKIHLPGNEIKFTQNNIMNTTAAPRPYTPVSGVNGSSHPWAQHGSNVKFNKNT